MATRKSKRPRTPEEVVEATLARMPFVTSGQVAIATGLSRQAVHAHLQRLVREGKLVAEGRGRAARYVRHRTHVRLMHTREGLDESVVYAELERALPALAELSVNVRRILHYVVTEMVNNAVDHSASDDVTTELRLLDDRVVGAVEDRGIGAFENVRATLGLPRALDAALELTKGKTTTDPARHTGQGLFFSSKAVDRFELESGGTAWIVDNRRGDQALGVAPPRTGTLVRFEIDRTHERTLRSVFDEWTTDLEFDRTRTVVRLFAHGTEFVSRSEAKRLLHGLERFREVVVDFAGVTAIGQGFADEVFRVWARAHAGTRLVPLNMVEPVEFMVKRALAQP